MESLSTLFALPGLDQDGGAKSTQQVSRYFTLADYISAVQGEAHPLEVISLRVRTIRVKRLLS